MKHLILVIAAVLLIFGVSAQNSTSHRVSGMVVDSLSAPVIGVVIQLSAQGNDTPVAASITDRDGKFILPSVPMGEFLLTTSHLTYNSRSLPCKIEDNMELPKIVLAENAQMIGVVTVLPENITQGVGSYDILLRNDPITAGKTAQEVLDFLPAVSSREGDLRIFGQAVSRVRIDGVLIEDRKELAAIQASNIDKVEVVYMSDVSDMAPGAGGEINIRLKKTRDGGFYGSLAGNTTMNFKYGNTMNGLNSSFNYGYKKWSIYNYIGYNYNNQYLDQGYLVRYLQTGENNRQADRTRGWDNYFSDRLSITYDINPKHTLGTNLRYGRSKNAPNFYSLSHFTDENWSELNNSSSEYDASVLNNQYQATLSYTWKLDDKGSVFNFKGDYLNYQTDNNKDYSNTYKIGLPDERVEYMNSILDNNVDMFYVDAKFNIKAGEKSEIEAGVNYNNNRTHQIINYTDLVNDSWVTDENLSDDYKLQGDNYAAFTSFSSSIGQRFQYQIGLRGERRRMSYNSVELKLKNEKNYNVLAAQVNLMYTLNQQKGRMLTLTYVRGANNIPYSSITPVVTYLDEYTYSKGNVDLKPSTFNMASFNFILNKNWSFRLIGLQSNNSLYEEVYADTDDSRVTYIMPVNAGRSISGDFYTEYKFKASKWWNVSAGILWELMETETSKGDFTSNMWIIRINNNFVWDKGFGGTLNLYYAPPTQADINRKLMTELSLTGSIYKTLPNDNWRISLQGVVYYLSRDNIAYTTAIWRKFYNDKDRYRVTLGVTYNFNVGKKVRVKQTSSQQSYNETLNTSK